MVGAMSKAALTERRDVSDERELRGNLPSVPRIDDLTAQIGALGQMDDVTVEVTATQSSSGERNVTFRLRAYKLRRS
jgi:hypothetical protein